MGTTSKLALPYPDPTSSVDVPRDIRALADAVDTKLGQTVMRVRRDIVQSFSSGAGVRLIFPTKTEDPAGMANTAGDTFTVKTAGLWLCEYFGQFSPNATGTRWCGIHLNGTEAAGSSTPNVGAAWSSRINCVLLARLAVNDVLFVQGSQTSGIALDLMAGTTFTMARIGP